MTSTRISNVFILGLHFYTVIPGKFCVWYVTYVSQGNETVDSFAFIVTKLSKTELDSFPNLQPPPYNAYLLNLELMVWELQVRLQNPLIRKLMGNQKGTFIITTTQDKIILDVQVQETEVQPTLSGAYLVCDSTQTFNCGSATEEPRMICDYWYPKMLQGSSVEDIEVYIKCTLGVYNCSSSACKKPANKKTRGDLQICDLFSPMDHQLTLENEVYTFRVYSAPFHFLWVNKDALWNGCLSEFFRALHNRIFNNFKGFIPPLTYAFPGGAPGPTEFGAHFGAFPFTLLFFESPSRAAPDAMAYRLCPSILLSWIPTSIRPVTDCLLTRGITFVPNNTISMWPLLVQDVNIKLQEEETEGLIRICEAHTTVHINFVDVLYHMCGCILPFEKKAAVELMIKYGSTTLVEQMGDVYNFIMQRMFKWATSRGLTWAYINKTELLLISKKRLSNEVSKLPFDL
uniref:Helicase-primase complex component n=2 Tax=Bovine herpesvirus 4 TaxID=10385 RepID=A0A0F6N4Y6_BHV4|nr:helicase-primase complex component [Bovine gammaherpesvirus 4]QJC19167.1 helicase-primase complex component [Bovine gammaherpesvirus 4]